MTMVRRKKLEELNADFKPLTKCFNSLQDWCSARARGGVLALNTVTGSANTSGDSSDSFLTDCGGLLLVVLSVTCE